MPSNSVVPIDKGDSHELLQQGSPQLSEAFKGEEKDAAAEKGSPPEAPSRFVLCLRWIWGVLGEHWFMIGIFVAIGIAAAVPDLAKSGGWIAAQWSIKYGAVIVIFFLTGLSLKTSVLLQAVKRLPLHLLVQAVSLGATPLIGWGVATALLQAKALDATLMRGIVVCACMPTTIATNQVFTKQAGGTEAVAVINAVLGNVVGIFISPALLSAYSGNTGQAPYGGVIRDLAVTVIAPLVAGQLLQFGWPKGVKVAQGWVPFGKVSNAMILLLVLHTFSNTFAAHIHIDAASVIVTIVVQLALFLSYTAACLALSYVPLVAVPLRMDRADAIAVALCGATKTLALGIPLILALFGAGADVGVLSLPLMIYHAEQVLFGHLLIPPMSRWRQRRPQGALPDGLLPADSPLLAPPPPSDVEQAPPPGPPPTAPADALPLPPKPPSFRAEESADLSTPLRPMSFIAEQPGAPPPPSPGAGVHTAAATQMSSLKSESADTVNLLRPVSFSAPSGTAPARGASPTAAWHDAAPRPV